MSCGSRIEYRNANELLPGTRSKYCPGASHRGLARSPFETMHAVRLARYEFRLRINGPEIRPDAHKPFGRRRADIFIEACRVSPDPLEQFHGVEIGTQDGIRF